jgi:hypothetical protein
MYRDSTNTDRAGSFVWPWKLIGGNGTISWDDSTPSDGKQPTVQRPAEDPISTVQKASDHMIEPDSDHATIRREWLPEGIITLQRLGLRTVVLL